MRKHFLALLVCLLTCARGSPLHAQQGGVLNAAATTTCAAPGNAYVVVPLAQTMGGATLTVTANASGNTISFYASTDDPARAPTNWFALNATPSNSSTAATSTTSTGSWQANVAGYTYVCMEMSTLVSGTSTVQIRPSTASARAVGGGGGGGGTTVANTATLVQSGLVADYQFTAGSGTTVADASGNGNAATFCGTGPSWLTTPPGVRITSGGTTQCIGLPTGLNSVLGASGGATIQILFYFDANDGTSANYTHQYICLLCSNGNGATSHAGGIVLAQTTGNDTANDTSYLINGMSTTAGPSSSLTWADTETTWQGAGVLTYVSNPSGQDSMYINGRPIGTGSFNQDFAAGAPFTGQFFLGANLNTGFAFATSNGAMNYYRVAIYNRKLSAAEVMTNSSAMNFFTGQTSLVPTVPCCMGALNGLGGGPGIGGLNNNNDKQDQIVLFADSVFNQNATNWMTKFILNGGPWSLINSAENGNSAFNFITSSPYSEDPLFRAYGGRNVLFFAYGNDMPGITGYNQYQQIQLVGTRALAAGWVPMIATLPTRTTAGFDTARDAFNSNLRSNCPNIIWCPILVDVAADLNLGADGNGSNVTYFADGVHVNATSLFNNITMIVQRQVNRWYGNKTFTSANTYSASGTNTIATTGASESGNLATITVAAVGPCVAGAEVFVTGMLPAGYNTPAGQDGWFIESNATGSITFYDFNTALGAQTQAGTIHCAQQVDADDHFILGGAAAGQIFYLESCIGQVQPTFILVTDTNATPWVLTPWNSSQTINGATTMNTPVAAATDNQLLELDPIFSGSVSAGCTWKAHF